MRWLHLRPPARSVGPPFIARRHLTRCSSGKRWPQGVGAREKKIRHDTRRGGAAREGPASRATAGRGRYRCGVGQPRVATSYLAPRRGYDPGREPACRCVSLACKLLLVVSCLGNTPTPNFGLFGRGTLRRFGLFGGFSDLLCIRMRFPGCFQTPRAACQVWNIEFRVHLSESSGEHIRFLT
jgi:hypothetical protein